MASAADVIILGAGIIGCAIARELARQGARVRVFESRSVGAGATQASAGMLAPYIESAHHAPLRDLGARSLNMYDEFVRDVETESGVAIEYRRCGTLEVTSDPDAAARFEWPDVADATSIGAEWLDPARARSLEPSLPESISGARLVKSHGYVSANQLTEALTWAALRHGAEFETGRRAAGITETDGGVELVTDDGSMWSGDSVVIATGSWTGQLGVAEPAAAAVRPVRGQLLRLSWRGAPLRHVIWGADCYVVPWKDGTVLVGATVEDVGFDERTTAAGVRDLLGAVCELLPAAWGATFVEARVGLRPATSDGLPILGPSSSIGRCVYATGHYRNGILLAPVTAAIVAEWILNARPDPLFEQFGPARFARPEQES